MLVWGLTLGSHLTPEMLRGEHRGAEKEKQLAEPVCPHLGLKKRQQLLSGRMACLLTEAAFWGPFLNGLGSLTDRLGPAEAPQPCRSCRAAMRWHL